VEKISKNKIKFLRSLGVKKNRTKERLFIVEGEKIVKEVLQLSRQLVQEVYVEKGIEFEELANFEAVFEITSTEASQISTFKTPNKCLALLKFPEIKPQNTDFTLVLDQVQDPGNLGTIIRLADWFGVDDVVCSTDTADCFNPKVIQATMGSIFRVNLAYTDLSTYLKNENRPIYGALMEGENVYKKELNSKAILIVGNEGNGISAEVQALVSDKISIPRFGKAESLNVANAAGILLSEFFRS
jgi:TrmH family RNA methyltransferase